MSGHMSGNIAAETDEIEWAPSPERQALAEALRRLLDVAVNTGAGPAELGAAAAVIDEVTANLAGPVIRADFSIEPNSYRSHMSLVGGVSHPIAPQLHMEVAGNSASGVVAVSKLFEGGPGLCHGGIVALLVDHAMGCVANQASRPAMTVRLTLHYRRPTPIEVPLTVSVRLDRIEGRQLHLSATVATPDEVTVEADGIFLVLTSENLGAVFGPR
jgi:acyl-coenzyme A thioesterase PaaI-like protein